MIKFAAAPRQDLTDMLKELIHFAIHAPETLALSRKLSHAELYDTLMLRGEKTGMSAWRSSLVQDIDGTILEIGCGTGLMFKYYNHSSRLSALELMPEFLELAKERANTAKTRISMCIGNGGLLPYRSNTFDYVVFALVLCSVPSVPSVLKEAKRVLRDGGELRLIEHVRSTNRIHGVLMDVLNPVWLALNKQGCNMNRQTESLLHENGFRLKGVSPFKIFTPGIPAFPIRWMQAVPV